MEHTTDELLTNAFRSRVQNLKTQGESSNAKKTAHLAIIITIGAAKWSVLSAVVWFAWNTFSGVAGTATLSYLQIVFILAGARSLTMLLIDPIISEFTKIHKD